MQCAPHNAAATRCIVKSTDAHISMTILLVQISTAMYLCVKRRGHDPNALHAAVHSSGEASAFWHMHVQQQNQLFLTVGQLPEDNREGLTRDTGATAAETYIQFAGTGSDKVHHKVMHTKLVATWAAPKSKETTEFNYAFSIYHTSQCFEGGCKSVGATLQV